MQGRLTPDPENLIQFFPTDNWMNEFKLAHHCGFNEIELIMDYNNWESNPVMTAEGRETLMGLSNDFEITINSLCFDFIMQAPIFNVTSDVLEERLDQTLSVMRNASKLGIKFIEFPLVGNMAIKSQTDLGIITNSIYEILLPEFESNGVSILLESDLSPKSFAELLESFDGKVGANYDTGNSVFFGYDPIDEFSALKDFIWNIHIKDCNRSDIYRNVPLGEGDADFATCFDLFAKTGYDGSFILQTARMKDDVEAASRFLTFTRQKLKDHFIAQN